MPGQGAATAKPGAAGTEPLVREDPRVEALLTAKAGQPVEPDPPDASQAGDCGAVQKAQGELKASQVGLMITPAKPRVGQEVRVVVASLATEDPLAISLTAAKNSQPERELRVRSGVPAVSVLRFTPTRAGRHRVAIGRVGTALRCHGFKVAARAGKRAKQGPGPGDASKLWPVRRRWNAGEEALFSAWVRELFHAPADQDLAWAALHEASSDRERNLLHNYLGMGEDEKKHGLVLKPDCADTPYFLRAYYAWKRRLPFVFHRCNRGRGGKAPRCYDARGNLGAPDLSPKWLPTAPEGEPVAAPQGGSPAIGDEPPQIDATALMVAQRFFRRTLAWGVHTGNGRIPHGDAASDFYPLKFTRAALRPGAMYADPYGHILVVAEWVPGADGGPGILFAVDGQPDASITRKRFWEGNFLWNPDPSLGGSGFKGFRPVVVEDGQTRVLSDEEIAKQAGYRDVELGGSRIDATAFYDRMEGLITPGVRNPFLVQRGVVAALAEAVRIRVTSVENGLRWVAEHPGEVVEMPTGHAVFETTGAWENYSTPARDLRLLIAIDVVLGFASKVERNPENFGLGDPELRALVKARLDEQLKAELERPEYAIEYRRSDGSKQRLSLSEVVARRRQFELAYNPNDCPELRWGALPDSKEAASCDRRAPAAQQAKMAAYRPWFADRRRPARGDSGPAVGGH